MRILQKCGCGDPRFPLPDKMQHCKAADPVARKCLEELMFEMGGDKNFTNKLYKKKSNKGDTIELNFEQEVHDARLSSDGGASCSCQQVFLK